MFWLFSAFFFFNFSIVGVYVVFLPKILKEIGYEAFEIGVVFSAAPLIRFFMPFFFLKHFSLNKRVVSLALLTLFLSVLSFYITIDNFYLFLISILLYSLSSSVILPYIESFSVDFLKKDGYGKARLFGSLGFMIASLALAKFLKSYIDGLNFFLFFTLMTIFFSIFILIIYKDRDFKKRVKRERGFSFGKDLGLWINIFLMQVSFGAFYNFFTIYENSHGVGIDDVSYLWSFSIICEMAVFYFQSIFLKANLRFLISISTLITSFRWLIIYLFPSNLMFLYFEQSLHAVSFALYHSAVLNYLYKIYENKKLSFQFYYGFGFGLGGFIGSILSGYLYGKNLFLYASLIAFLGYLSMSRVVLKVRDWI